jgi:hypothetical protein
MRHFELASSVSGPYDNAIAIGSQTAFTWDDRDDAGNGLARGLKR